MAATPTLQPETLATATRWQSSLASGDDPKCRHRPVKALQHELAGAFARDRAVERRLDALRNEDLVALRFAAQARREVGDGADRAVVDPPRKADAADRREALR